MEASPKTEAPSPAPAAAEQEPAYVFPDITKGPRWHFDSPTRGFWIGLRVDMMDWEECKLWVESCMFHGYQIWRSIAQQRAAALEDLKRGNGKPGGIMGKLANLGILRGR